MKKLTVTLMSVFFFASMLISSNLKAQEANMGDDYLKGLSKTWKASMDALVRQNLIKSYKILVGEA